jgi:hypothetical protein
MQNKLTGFQSMASAMSTAFGQLYDLSGKQIIAFFYLQKAANIATAIMNIATGITEALKLGPIIGPALAAVVAAAGGVQIATIIAQQPPKQQGAFTGRYITDGSGTKDDVHIMASKGEYVVQRKAVDKYGVSFMHAINKGMVDIPHQWALSINAMVPKISSPGFAYASGGPVSGNTTAQVVKNEIVLMNITDRSLVYEALATPEGHNAIINILSAQADTIKRIVR